MAALPGGHVCVGPGYCLQGDVDGGVEGDAAGAGGSVHGVALADHHDVAGEGVGVGLGGAGRLAGEHIGSMTGVEIYADGGASQI
ncbi:hypothetical protein [Streptomyces sp. MAI_2237]